MSLVFLVDKFTPFEFHLEKHVESDKQSRLLALVDETFGFKTISRNCTRLTYVSITDRLYLESSSIGRISSC